MKSNIGCADRSIRIVVGIIIIALGFAYQTWWGLVGLLPLVTALVRFCPAYTLFGMNTCSTDSSCKAEEKKPEAKNG
jgi:hypothetical protein